VATPDPGFPLPNIRQTSQVLGSAGIALNIHVPGPSRLNDVSAARGSRQRDASFRTFGMVGL